MPLWYFQARCSSLSEDALSISPESSGCPMVQTNVAALWPDPMARCQGDQQRPTFLARAASELVESITPTMADRLSGCRNLCGLRGASAGEAGRRPGPFPDWL